MKRFPSARRLGFTMVEIMISFLIFGIVLSTGYLILNRTFVNMERQRQSLDTLHEARNFLALIERDLREMTKLTRFDTIFKDHLFVEENALMHSITLEIPDRRTGVGTTEVTYSYEGPAAYQELPGKTKVIYRQEAGQVKRPIIAKQLKFLKVWGTDGVIFRNRLPTETLEAYRNYLMPHYYHPTNPAANGLKDLTKVRGVEVQLAMNEIYDLQGKPIKSRLFITRIYSRVLNAKHE